MNAFKTNDYNNLFKLIGKTDEEVYERLMSIRDTFFFGPSDKRIYFPFGDDMGYLTDTGNDDVRTEGMSYGMMIAVQLDMKEEFDRIWKWAYTYMLQKNGIHQGYFAWSCSLEGKHNDEGAAPDGEEYFALALFFASHRWGDGEGIFEYSKHARDILHSMIHKGESDEFIGFPMFNRDNHQILFVAGIDFTDPSYHLPHFYELFSLWAYEEDREFFKEAVKASREYLIKSCHPKTGMSAEYAEFDGSPFARKLPWSNDRHDCFYSDSYRTAANIGLDYEWFGTDIGQCLAPKNLITTLDTYGDEFGSCYEIDGTMLDQKALHPVGLMCTTTEGLLAVVREDSNEETLATARKWLKRLWNTPLREGKRRYYDNCLYFFSFLALGGYYRIW